MWCAPQPTSQGSGAIASVQQRFDSRNTFQLQHQIRAKEPSQCWPCQCIILTAGHRVAHRPCSSQGLWTWSRPGPAWSSD